MENEKIKMVAEQYQTAVHCPVDNSLLGRYDSRRGLVNTTFYCRKCKLEYTFTIKPAKND